MQFSKLSPKAQEAFKKIQALREFPPSDAIKRAEGRALENLNLYDLTIVALALKEGVTQ
jgi:hypothetical protein